MDSHSAPTLQEELPAGNTTPVKLGFAVQAATPLFSPSLIQHSPATQGRFFSPQTARDLLDGHTEQMQIASMPGKVVGETAVLGASVPANVQYSPGAPSSLPPSGISELHQEMAVIGKHFLGKPKEQAYPRQPSPVPRYDAQLAATAITPFLRSSDKAEVENNVQEDLDTVQTPSLELQCEVCQRSFRQSAHLKNHSRTHTLERPFVCGICGKDFAQTSTMQRHVQSIHNPKTSRKHACGHCGVQFCRRDHLLRHQRSKHSKLPF